VIEKLGTEEELRKKLEGRDPIEWAKEYIADLNEQDKQGTRVIKVEFSPSAQIPLDSAVLFNGGYLFLQAIYYKLKLDEVCRVISEKYRFEYDLNAILCHLICTRILYPSSKLSSFESARCFLEPPGYALVDVYRALDVFANESDVIQAQVYQSSLCLVKRNTGILYYDCTNYFFEIEREDEIRQYGVSKEHRPNPIVQMGLFMDGSGIPLAFSIHPGATNEQPTLKPLEERLMNDFSLSKFVVCTDAGLGSLENRMFNNAQDRAFVVTQSLKKMKKFLIEWALHPEGWRLPGDKKKEYHLSLIDDTSENPNTYYKERWIKEEGLEQKLIVSYSPKYKAYQQEIRAGQILRAKRMVDNPAKLKRKKQNDPARFVEDTRCTQEGQVANCRLVSLNQVEIEKEERFDGFYGVCTNLDEDIEAILKINKGRWEIEESFRMLKSEFRTRPVYLSRETRIKAHFLTCFLSLLVYRILENMLGLHFTVQEIVRVLREMDFYKLKDDGFLPAYTRSLLTDALHNAFGFCTDMQILTKKKLKGILRSTKNH
jgi:hypothetical protein